jgi:uncharacterized protein (TIGR02466 family)
MSTGIHPLFSFPVYETDLNIENSIHKQFLSVIKSLNFYQYFDCDNLKNGLISNEQNVLNLDNLVFLKDLIELQLKTYLYEILQIKKDNHIKHLCSWAVKHQFGDKSHEHSHNNSLFSGVYYLSVPKDSGESIIFHRADKYAGVKPQFEEYNIFNSDTWKINVTEKKLLIFPSNLKHSVPISKTHKPRYAISFNYFLSGI